jgi:hypothetical protein
MNACVYFIGAELVSCYGPPFPERNKIIELEQKLKPNDGYLS